METFTDDTVVALASFLSPHDMLSLALTCRRFGSKNGTATSRSRRMAAKEANKSRGSDREVRQRTESISLMEVAARTVLQAKWTDEEKKALPRREDESWIGLYHEFLKLFRLPLQFDKLVGNGIQYKSNTGKTSVCSIIGYRTGTAICGNIMRAGKHHVSFQVNDNDPSLNYEISCGIMRPTTEDITSLQRCSPTDDDLSGYSLKDYGILHRNNVDCCLVDACMGCCLTRKRWKIWEESELMRMNGEQRMKAEIQNLCEPSLLMEEETEDASFKIGMVLDFDEGTLDLYKNDRRIGTMKTGLVGEYCWVVSMFVAASDEVEETSVSIGR